MTKTELIKKMELFTGSAFISRNELTKFMGYKSPASVDQYIYGLQRIEKRYFIPDVADVLIKRA